MTALVSSFVFAVLLAAAAFRRLFGVARKVFPGFPPALAVLPVCFAIAFLPIAGAPDSCGANGAGTGPGITIVPVAGIPVHRWIASFFANFSIPLATLLFGVVWRAATGRPLLREQDRTAFWTFGLLAGLFLYPMSLGLGPVDPYEPGWHFSWLFSATGVIAALLILRGNRLGYALLLAIAGWHLGLLESTNLWDYLVDPAYFIASVVALTGRALRRATSRRVPRDAPAVFQ